MRARRRAQRERAAARCGESGRSVVPTSLAVAASRGSPSEKLSVPPVAASSSRPRRMTRSRRRAFGARAPWGRRRRRAGRHPEPAGWRGAGWCGCRGAGRAARRRPDAGRGAGKGGFAWGRKGRIRFGRESTRWRSGGGQHVIGELGRHLHHAPGVTGRADAATFAREGHEALGGARVGADPGEAVGEDAAAEVGAEVVLDTGRCVTICAIAAGRYRRRAAPGRRGDHPDRPRSSPRASLRPLLRSQHARAPRVLDARPV
jgi:hypothetical protein